MAQYQVKTGGAKAVQSGGVATVAMAVAVIVAAKLQALGLFGPENTEMVTGALAVVAIGAFEFIRNYLKHAFFKAAEDREPSE